MTAVMPDETYDWDEAQARLREDADRGYPDPWIPEQAGDELLGTVVAVNEAAPTAYGPVPVVEVEQPNGERVSVWLHATVLRRAFERRQVALGEIVLIRYRGKHLPEGARNAYHDYVLVVDRPNPRGQPDWRTIAERYGDDIDEPPPAAKKPDADPFAGPDDEDIPF